ncbi:unnamed protein product [Caenorhabditis angaria]|uniref:Uncharacterized protein n=1 Tax=Caenorhabditis angaria TaxID=860376 RepID=A0A9P1I7M4_9PELO|nr:unnamed protein product [Caenorhabditis angaria]
MAECFAKNPDERPTFWEILKKLSPDENAEKYSKIVPLSEGSDKRSEKKKEEEKKTQKSIRNKSSRFEEKSQAKHAESIFLSPAFSDGGSRRARKPRGLTVEKNNES